MMCMKKEKIVENRDGEGEGEGEGKGSISIKLYIG